MTSFQLFRHRRNEPQAFLYTLDLLELNGTDLRREPIEVRKATLASILRKSRPGLRLNEHLERPEGEVVFRLYSWRPHDCATSSAPHGPGPKRSPTTPSRTSTGRRYAPTTRSSGSCEIRRRTRVVGAFPDGQSCLTRRTAGAAGFLTIVVGGQML